MQGPRGRIAVLLLASGVVPAPLLAQTAPAQARLTVLATVGAMRPSEAGVRDLYGGTFVPVTIEADIRLAGTVFVFGSGQFLDKDGEAVFSLPPAPEERFPLRVTTSSLRVGGGFAFPRRRWLIVAEGGFSYTHYSERWTTEDIPTVTGHAYGAVLAAGVDYRLGGPVWAIGRFEYAYTPTGVDTQLTPTFDLSGFSVSGGMAVRF